MCSQMSSQQLNWKSACESHSFFRKAIEMCARRDELNPDELKVLQIYSGPRTVMAYIGLRNEVTGPSYVIKIKSTHGGWSGKREYEGLKHLATVFGAGRSGGHLRLGAITPMGYLLEPPTLVTRFQPGANMRRTFDKAILRRRSVAELSEARNYARALAAWLLALRSSGVKHGGGFTPEVFLATCHQQLEKIRGSARARRCGAVIVDRMTPYLNALGNEDREVLRDSHPVHGDFSPQNFLVDEGVLYALDVGRFCYYPVNGDAATFRVQLERYVLRSPFARGHAQAIWHEFWDALHPEGAARRHTLLSYLFRVLVILAAETTNSERSQRIRVRLRNALWFRNRLDWCRELDGRLDVDCQYLRDRL